MAVVFAISSSLLLVHPLALGTDGKRKHKKAAPWPAATTILRTTPNK